MAMRPNFDTVEIDGANLVVSGQSDDEPLPVEIRIFIEQDGRVAHGVGSAKAGVGVDKPTTGWTATFGGEGFHTGPALGFGVEIRTLPFEASSWSQIVDIE